MQIKLLSTLLLSCVCVLVHADDIKYKFSNYNISFEEGNTKALDSSFFTPVMQVKRDELVGDEENEDKAQGDLVNATWYEFEPGSIDALMQKNFIEPEEFVEYCAFPEATSWDGAYLTVICLESLKSKGANIDKILFVEPNLININKKLEKYSDRVSDTNEYEGPVERGEQAVFKRTAKHSRAWPKGEPGWHLQDEYSQLLKTRKTLNEKLETMAARNTPVRTVKVFQLDTGVLYSDESLPENFQVAGSKSFFDGEGTAENPKKNTSSHGTRTLSTFAGSPFYPENREDIIHNSEDNAIGAFPEANISAYRIGNSPVHFDSRRMSKAIKDAVENGADVITLSAGGLPSGIQRDAVNHAYLNGTAIFAAAGNHGYVPVIGSVTPRMTVFPARYNRVIAVAGATYDLKSYGDSSCYICLLRIWDWKRTWAPWMLRGNYGPESVMDGHMITAYTTNILHSTAKSGFTASYGLDGMGTSHATPQVAAAAAMWLQYHGSEISDEDWTSWKKTEGVYKALTDSASCKFEDAPHYTAEKFGVGILKSYAALEQNYNPPAKPRKKSEIGTAWVTDAVKSVDLFQSYSGVTWHTVLEDVLIDMAITEIEQRIMANEKLAKLLLKARLCSESERCGVRCDLNPDKLVKFFKALQNDKGISKFLKESLKKDLKKYEKKLKESVNV